MTRGQNMRTYSNCKHNVKPNRRSQALAKIVTDSAIDEQRCSSNNLHWRYLELFSRVKRKINMARFVGMFQSSSVVNSFRVWLINFIQWFAFQSFRGFFVTLCKGFCNDIASTLTANELKHEAQVFGVQSLTFKREKKPLKCLAPRSLRHLIYSSMSSKIAKNTMDNCVYLYNATEQPKMEGLSM